MRIAMFFSSDPSRAGGVQEHVFFLSRELRKLGHSLTLFGPKSNVLPFEDYVEVGEIKMVPIPNGNWANVHIIPNEAEFFKKFDEAKYDVCHVHEPYVPYFSWQVLRKVNLPTVTSFHTGWNDKSIINMINPVLPFFKDIFSANAQGAIFISTLVQKRWSSLCDQRVDQRLISYGIDHEMFYPVNKKRHDKVSLLFMARLVARKGLHYLLESLAEVEKSGLDFELIVVGDGMQRREVEVMTERLGLNNKVKFEGEIMGKARVPYYQNADVFCAPYADEGLGLTVIEAQACGCPIVGFWNGAFEETLGDYPVDGLLVNQKDVAGLTKALIKVIESQKLRNELREWVIEKSKQFEWGKVALETSSFYEDVVKNKGVKFEKQTAPSVKI